MATIKIIKAHNYGHVDQDGIVRLKTAADAPFELNDQRAAELGVDQNQARRAGLLRRRPRPQGQRRAQPQQSQPHAPQSVLSHIRRAPFHRHSGSVCGGGGGFPLEISVSFLCSGPQAPATPAPPAGRRRPGPAPPAPA